MRESFSRFCRTLLVCFPFLFLLVQSLPNFIINPFGSYTFNLLITSISIHTFTVSCVCLQFVFMFFYLKWLKYFDKIIISFLSIAFSIQVYEQLHAIGYYTQYGLPSDINAILLQPITIAILVTSLYYYNKKIGVVSVNKYFILSALIFIILMILLPLSGFFQQLYLDPQQAFDLLWLSGKLFSSITFIAFFQSKKQIP